ncbi:hypothetical protein ON010_g16932 [Phytophthora cinnamomi]|nr:hypothetical protein ON010_g16932 [Phytophthora cinnamomi]
MLAATWTTNSQNKLNFDIVATAFAAHWHSSLWYLDSVGAIVISVYIAVSWLATGKEQVKRLVGLRMCQLFLVLLQWFKFALTGLHRGQPGVYRSDPTTGRPMMRTDIVRANHFGNYYLAEMEVILPADVCVKDAHDISLSLQGKVEELDNVESAFVHVDYLERNYSTTSTRTTPHSRLRSAQETMHTHTTPSSIAKVLVI